MNKIRIPWHVSNYPQRNKYESNKSLSLPYCGRVGVNLLHHSHFLEARIIELALGHWVSTSNNMISINIMHWFRLYHNHSICKEKEGRKLTDSTVACLREMSWQSKHGKWVPHSAVPASKYISMYLCSSTTCGWQSDGPFFIRRDSSSALIMYMSAAAAETERQSNKPFPESVVDGCGQPIKIWLSLFARFICECDCFFVFSSSILFVVHILHVSFSSLASWLLNNESSFSTRHILPRAASRMRTI